MREINEICVELCRTGNVISGYQVNDTWHLMAKGNPQWPQVRHTWLPVEILFIILYLTVQMITLCYCF